MVTITDEGDTLKNRQHNSNSRICKEGFHGDRDPSTLILNEREIVTNFRKSTGSKALSQNYLLPFRWRAYT